LLLIYKTLDENVYAEKGVNKVKIVKPFLIIDNRLINLYDLRIEWVKLNGELLYLLSTEDFTNKIKEE